MAVCRQCKLEKKGVADRLVHAQVKLLVYRSDPQKISLLDFNNVALLDGLEIAHKSWVLKAAKLGKNRLHQLLSGYDFADFAKIQAPNISAAPVGSDIH